MMALDGVYAYGMATHKTVLEIKQLIRDEIRSRKEYFKGYRKRKSVELNERNCQFQKAKRARSIHFTVYGYYDPKTQTLDIPSVIFNKRKYETH